jgi:tetratricopeptide (TPR) repeat protein
MFPRTTRPILALALFFLLAARPALADEEGKKLYQQTLRGTAFVVAPGFGTGTGWVVDRSQRLLITNHHVVEHKDSVLVLFPMFQAGKLVVERSAYRNELGLRGRVVDVDVPRDLALIQLHDPLPEGTIELKLAAESAEQTDQVHSIGNPSASGGLWVYTFGRVRSVYHGNWTTLASDGKTLHKRSCRVMETQSPLNSGDSGGPVVNDRGELVAVVSSGKEKHNNRTVHLMNWCIDVTEVRSYVDQGRRLLQPRTAADYNLRGLRFYERERYSDAITDYTEAIRLQKDFGAAYLNRGLAFLGKGDLDTAIADLTKALQLDPGDAVALQNRGRAYARKGDAERALPDFTRAIQINPKYALAYNNRGVLYHDQNELTRALADYTSAIEADPEMAMAWQNRGKVHHARGNYDQAILDCTAALKLNPTLTHAWELRGWSLMGKGEYDRAIQNFTEALELDPRNAAHWVHRGNAYTWKKQWDQAVANYGKAIEVNPNYAPAYYWRAWAFETNGNDAPAQADYSKALQLNPSYAEQVKTRHSRFLKIVNERSEPVRVYLQYEYQTKDGKWVWWPEQPGGKSSYWDISPGKETYLLDDGWRLKARRVRLWAVGLSSSLASNTWKDRDLWLCPTSGYLARNETTFTYTFPK